MVDNHFRKGILNRSISGLYVKSKILLILIVFLFISCSKPLTKENSQKHLRAFDNEITQLFTRMNNTEGLQALKQLSLYQALPLPMMVQNCTDSISGLQSYSFDLAKGNYLAQNEEFCLNEIGKSDSISIVFAYKSRNDSHAQFILSDYSEAATKLQMMFPKTIEACIIANGSKLISISEKAILKHDLPASIEAKISFGNFIVNLVMETTFRKSDATMHLKLQIEESGKSALTVKMITDVAFTKENSIVYNNKTIDIEVFPILIRFKSEQDFSNPDASHFIENFNSQSNFVIFDGKNQLIGEIFLDKISGRDRLNPMIRYSDGTVENLEDMLLFVRKLLNFKLVHL